jgi:hypothetical protein
MHHAAHNRTVTFLAENDLMGKMFDSHGGLVQTMTCHTDHLGPVGCHLLENTICNLISQCGNDKRWQSCDFSYQSMRNTSAPVDSWWALANEAATSSKSHDTRVLAIAATTILLYITATTLSIRWVWAHL